MESHRGCVTSPGSHSKCCGKDAASFPLEFEWRGEARSGGGKFLFPASSHCICCTPALGLFLLFILKRFLFLFFSFLVCFCFLILVLRSLIMLCLYVNVFMFIFFEVHRASWIFRFMIFACFKHLLALFFWTFFSPILQSSFWNSSDTNIRSLAIALQSLVALFVDIFQSIFFFSVVQIE